MDGCATVLFVGSQYFSLPRTITAFLLTTLLLFFSHSQIDPKVAFPRRAQPKVRINWSLSLLKENYYVLYCQLTQLCVLTMAGTKRQLSLYIYVSLL